MNPQSAEVLAVARLPKLISGTRAHVGLFIALACVAVYWFVCRYTQFGYNLRVVGQSPKAAQYAGCNVKRYRFLAMVLAGGFAGLAGAVEIYGVQYRLIEGICEGMGITGMVVALIGCLNPLGLVAASVMMADWMPEPRRCRSPAASGHARRYFAGHHRPVHPHQLPA